MPVTTKVTNISPMLLVADMDATLAFYQELLGFAPFLLAPDYSILERDGRLLHFKLTWSEEVMSAARRHTEVYLQVSGIDSLWLHIQPFRDRYRIRDLFEREYGMTEFHIEDPNGCILYIGEPTADRFPAS